MRSAWTQSSARRQALLATTLAAVAVALFVGVRTSSHGGALGNFALAGSDFVHAGAPSDLPVHVGSNGYDGQFYYRLALDPLTRQRTAFGITLDNPSYRQQRVGLPVAAWLMREIFRAPTSLALVLVNVLALVGLAWLGARWAQRFGRSPLWGLAIAASPALVIALARDLTEPLATAALVAGLLAWSRGRLALAALAFTIAALTRETVLAVLFGMGLWCLGGLVAGVRDRDRLRVGLAQLVALVIPAAAEIAWQLHVRSVWKGGMPTLAGSNPFGIPVVRVLSSLLTGTSHIGLSHQGVLDAAWLVERLLLLAFLVLVAINIRRCRADVEVRAGWIAAAVLALSVAWNQDAEFLRAANESIVVGQLLLLSRSGVFTRRILLGVAGWSALVAIGYAAAL